ncbi:hypothetical protein C6V05_22695 [Burkholderia multivorans]|nr:hypothetical protein C6V05_22695 [Burkholderia multivorans]
MVRRILAVILATVALTMMVLAVATLLPALALLMLRMTISTSISSSQPRRRAARLPKRIGSPRSRQK